MANLLGIGAREEGDEKMTLTDSQTVLGDRFTNALVYATHLHAEQRRKVSGVPYIAHLLSVTALVLEDGGTEDEAIAALLHDAIEDQGGAPIREAIRKQFGDEVVSIVDGCTEWDTPPKPPWKERKRRYLERLQQSTPSVQRVSLADKLHNARSLILDWRQVGDRIWDSFSQGRDETLWFYRELAQVYKEIHMSGLMLEFAQAVDELEQL